MARSGIAAGRDRGHITTVIPLKKRPHHNKGKKSAKVALVREIVRETVGFAPYERRVMELIKMASASSLKRALKYSKKKLGTHRRGKAKRDEMTEAIAAQRKKH